AIACPDPVIFLEPKARYWDKGPVPLHGPQETVETNTRAGAALQHAVVVREGTDLTLVGYGPTMRTLVAAARALEEEGASAEVIDLRSISPLDVDTVAASVRRTGRLVVVHEAPTYFGAGAELAARIQAECFYHLQAPVLRVGGFHTPYPVAGIEEDYLPDLDRVLHAADESLSH